MKFRTIARKFGSKLAVAGTLMGGATVAMADGAAAVAKMEGAESDINLIGWAGIGLVIAAVMFKYIRRAA